MMGRGRHRELGKCEDRVGRDQDYVHMGIRPQGEGEHASARVLRAQVPRW